MQYLLGILLFLGFYLTPVIYDSRAIPLQAQTLYHLNPMVTIVDAYRSVFIHAQFPESLPLLLVGLVSVILLWITSQIFRKASYRFAEELSGGRKAIVMNGTRKACRHCQMHAFYSSSYDCFCM